MAGPAPPPPRSTSRSSRRAPMARRPPCTLTSPTDGTTGLSGSPTFTATATDNVGVVGVVFQVDGVTLSEDLTAPYQATLPATSAYATGVHVVRARARDAAGNLSSWSAARVTFNGSALPTGFSRTTFVSPAFTAAPRPWLGAPMVGSSSPSSAAPFAWSRTERCCPPLRDGRALPRIGERGLLGVTFHPQFATNDWVYLYYTSRSGGAHNRIVRVDRQRRCRGGRRDRAGGPART